MTITRKIQLALNKEDLSKILNMSNLMPRLHNQIVTNIFLNDLVRDRMATQNKLFKSKIDDLDTKIKSEFDKLKGVKDKLKRDKGMCAIEKLKKKRSTVSLEAKKEFDKLFKEAFGKQFDGSVYNIIREDEYLKELNSSIASSALANLGFYKKDIWKIKVGEERIGMYSKGMPIPCPKQAFKLKYENDEFTFNWVDKIKGKLYFGKDKSNNRIIIERVYDGIYKLSDSSVQIKKGKAFLNLCVDIPNNNNKLDKDKVVGVDLGLAVPAYCAMNKGQDRLSIGGYDDFIKIRKQFEQRRIALYKSLKTAKGGHGRNRKLKAEDKFKDKERNWVKTYNHKVSKEVVKFAVKNKAGIINLEFLKGYEGNTPQSKFILRNWSYFELQQFIEYKAKIEGIEVRYVDPYHTSQTCSCCGNYEKGQRKSQDKFICSSCGEEMNADYNAAVNIARSEKVVTKKSDCEYYRKDK